MKAFQQFAGAAGGSSGVRRGGGTATLNLISDRAEHETQVNRSLTITIHKCCDDISMRDSFCCLGALLFHNLN